MKRLLLYSLILIGLISPTLLFCSDKEKTNTPLFQLSGGMASSSIDLTRYQKSIAYRGFHVRMITHVYNPFFFSVEYSSFPAHDLSVSWKDIHTNKLDFNGQVSYSTDNNHTRIYALIGADRFSWQGTNVGNNNPDLPNTALLAENMYKIKRWGLNSGIGFTHLLYDMIGVFGDCRFTICRTNSWERVQITDVMTTFGINFSIPYPQKKSNKKSSSLGNKLYKWTKKGAKK
jgi:hypothetical protein